MPDRFWIQVDTNGVVVGKQRDNGRGRPPSTANRMIRVREDYYQRCLHNIADAQGEFIPNLRYKLDESTIPVPDRVPAKDAIIDDRRSMATEAIAEEA